MDMGLYDNLTYSSDELWGFSESTLIVLASIFVASFLVRYLVSTLSHRFVSVIISNDEIRKKAVKKGDSALGTAAASVFAFTFCSILWDERSENANIVIPSWLEYLPDVLQFLLVFFVVVWAFRLVSLVYDVVKFFDKDGELDGTEKTLISALESTLRFVIA